MEENITVGDIVDITKGILVYGNRDEVCENFSKDTETINNNDIFIGIKGEKYDGSRFYKEAFNKGAKGCIINKLKEQENIINIPGKFMIIVEDTIKAIQEIATYKREKYNIPVIAITGSVGKTSTKDIIASVLSEKYIVLKTQGNMNNHIGLPMTILKLKNQTALVVEMGMNHLGEIEILTKIAKPTIVVITNIGTAHIGNLESRENILKAKLEIIEGLKEDGIIIINNDNDLLHKWYLEKKSKYNIITYGIINNSTNVATKIEYEDMQSKFQVDNQKIKVPIGGDIFIYNSLAAVSVGKILKIEGEKIAKGIAEFELSKMRLDVKKTPKGYTIINDCYNANYDSMKASIEYLKNLKGGRKIAVLGDMLELGNFSEEMHKKIGKIVANNKINILITVGKQSKYISEEANKCGCKEIYKFEKNEEAIKCLKNTLKNEDIILIKASNSMNFKEIVQQIMND